MKRYEVWAESRDVRRHSQGSYDDLGEAMDFVRRVIDGNLHWEIEDTRTGNIIAHSRKSKQKKRKQ